MKVTEEELAALRDRPWTEGFRMICQRQREIALKALVIVDPNNLVMVARAQAAFAMWEKDIPSIAEAFTEFVKPAAKPAGAG